MSSILSSVVGPVIIDTMNKGSVRKIMMLVDTVGISTGTRTVSRGGAHSVGWTRAREVVEGIETSVLVVGGGVVEAISSVRSDVDALTVGYARASWAAGGVATPVVVDDVGAMGAMAGIVEAMATLVVEYGRTSDIVEKIGTIADVGSVWTAVCFGLEAEISTTHSCSCSCMD